MIAHEEMLAAAQLLVAVKGKNEFSPQEIFKVVKCAGSKHPVTDIRTEMFRCCINCPRHHETPHDYFERICHGKYRLV